MCFSYRISVKSINVKLELLTNFSMLLVVEKRIRGGLCHFLNRYANNKYLKDYGK